MCVMVSYFFVLLPQLFRRRYTSSESVQLFQWISAEHFSQRASKTSVAERDRERMMPDPSSQILLRMQSSPRASKDIAESSPSNGGRSFRCRYIRVSNPSNVAVSQRDPPTAADCQFDYSGKTKFFRRGCQLCSDSFSIISDL